MKNSAKNNRPDFSKTIAFLYVLLVLACFSGRNVDYNADTDSPEKISLQNSEEEAPKAILPFSFNFPDEAPAKTASSNRHFSGFDNILNNASSNFFEQLFHHQSEVYLSIKPLLLEKRGIIPSSPVKEKGDPLPA